MADICYLKDYVNCGSGESGFVEAGAERLSAASKRRGDNLHERLSLNPSVKYRCHKSCVSTYTSSHHIKRYLSQHTEVSVEPTAKRSRSQETTFNFKEHCLFCGEVCLELDARNPSRWQRVVKCRTADRGDTQKTFKDVILATCEARNDEWAYKVRLRVLSAVSDLHAADAQYHKDCMAIFNSKKNIGASGSKDDFHDDAFHYVEDCMLRDNTRIWNAVEIEQMYRTNGGTVLSRKLLIQKLSQQFQPDLLVLSAAGVANILVFKHQASKHMKLVANDEDDIDTALDRVAKHIALESKQLKRDQSTYDTRINVDDALTSSSPALLSLLSQISSNLDSTLAAAMVGNIITSAASNKPTSLQISLGVVLREKSVIELLHKFGITSTYDEVLRYRCSAAHAATKSKEQLGISHSDAGLVQVVADNFDANISSPNGLQSTHALAILLTQSQQSGIHHSVSDYNKIRRVNKREMAGDILPDVPVQHYGGTKKPQMPVSVATCAPLPLRVLTAQIVSINRARQIDFEFINDVTSVPKTPEFGGFNTRRSRKQGHGSKPRTKAVYLPLIDMVPAEPNTMLTAMVEAQRLTNSTGQVYTIFTNDQQLYRVAVNITWVYNEQFVNFIPRLGGMHTLMNFIGSVGTLMVDSGLEQVMETAFGGVTKMLSGKKYPQNFRALRMVVEELLRHTVSLEQVQSYDQLMEVLDTRATRSRTTRHWLDNLIKPVFTMMLFMRAEREADWPLHLFATLQMIPYFFSSGHFNYARYCLYYLHSMNKLPDPALKKFMQGSHVMRHQPGIWNGIWSDQYIESTFMRYGHSPGGIIGITLQPSTLKRWALSLHICTQLRKDITSMADGDIQTTVTTHKEEGQSRVQTDARDREKLRHKLLTCIDPLNPECHAAGLINIVTGRISPGSVNVDNSLQLGTQLMHVYKQGWPQSFHKPLTKPVVLMSVSRKQLKVDNIAVYDTSLIYSRVLCLQKVRDINMENVLSYELAGIPPSMFDEKSGEMRSASSKSTLKTKLQVEVTDRRAVQPDGLVLDGCAILWVIAWPNHGTVEDFIRNVLGYIVGCLQTADTYLVFDRYNSNSIKEATRTARAGKDASRQHQLHLVTPLPSQKVCLTVTHNKVQLISLICGYLQDKHDLLPHNGRKLVVTGPEPTPVEICDGIITERVDLRTTHEEADVIIIQQVIYLAASGKLSIRVMADDTDVFVLLTYFCKMRKLTCNLLMVGTSPTRSSVDIRATADTHADIIQDLLPAHSLTGCDTVSSLWGIGKATVLKALKSGRILSKLGDTQEQLADIISQATEFVAACYGFPHEGTMTKLRYRVWSTKMASNKINAAPELKVLPPTTEAFKEHVCRAHLQTAIWRGALNPDPPELNPVQYGWSFDAGDNTLSPTALPADASPAPMEVLKMIKCGCSSSQPCSTTRCSCASAQLSCSVFCTCRGNEECRNQRTIMAVTADDDDDDDNDVSNDQ